MSWAMCGINVDRVLHRERKRRKYCSCFTVFFALTERFVFFGALDFPLSNECLLSARSPHLELRPCAMFFISIRFEIAISFAPM